MAQIWHLAKRHSKSAVINTCVKLKEYKVNGNMTKESK